MKFLLDMNLPRALANELQVSGHQARHVGDLGMSQASDVEILTEALCHDEVVLTHDLDYGHLLAFTGAASPSVIIFRTRRTDCATLARRFEAEWAGVEQSLERGAIVILEDGATRIRHLPVARRPGS